MGVNCLWFAGDTKIHIRINEINEYAKGWPITKPVNVFLMRNTIAVSESPEGFLMTIQNALETRDRDEKTSLENILRAVHSFFIE